MQEVTIFNHHAVCVCVWCRRPDVHTSQHTHTHTWTDEWVCRVCVPATQFLCPFWILSIHAFNFTTRTRHTSTPSPRTLQVNLFSSAEYTKWEPRCMCVRVSAIMTHSGAVWVRTCKFSLYKWIVCRIYVGMYPLDGRVYLYVCVPTFQISVIRVYLSRCIYTGQQLIYTCVEHTQDDVA